MAYNRFEDLLKPETNPEDEDDEEDQDDGYIHKYKKLENYSSSSSSLVINSRVIGASLSVKSDFENANIVLSHPIRIILKHNQEENVSRPQCVYWNEDLNNWKGDGCWVEATNLTHTVCMCNHLTHFALLMDMRPYEVLTNNNNWLRILTSIGCVVASLCLSFVTLMLFLVKGDNSEALSIHRNLSITLLITELTFMLGMDRTDTPFLCGLTAGFLHFFLLAAFIWTFLESFDLYVNLIDVYETMKSSNRLWWYYVLAYVGPSAIIIISVCIDPYSYGTETYCWLRVDNYFCFSFVGPAIGIIFGGIVFISISCFILCQNTSVSAAIKGKDEAKVDDIKFGLKWILVLLCLQCATWTFGLVYVNIQSSSLAAVTFTLLNIILGVFIVIYCSIRTENIQHHRFVHFMPWMTWCVKEDSECTNSKGNIHNTAYGTNRLPVVTQVATQVAAIMPSPSQHHSIIGNDSNLCSPSAPTTQIPSVRFCSIVSGIASPHQDPASTVIVTFKSRITFFFNIRTIFFH